MLAPGLASSSRPLGHFVLAGRCSSRRPTSLARRADVDLARSAPRRSSSSRSRRASVEWAAGRAWDRPLRLSADDRAIVEALAGQAAQALERARPSSPSETIAETLQRSVLPVSLPRVEGVQLAARYLPGTAQLDVGGDWFDALQLPDGKLGLVVGDVVGKGVQAAASMAQLRNAIRAFSVERLKPPSVLTRLNRLADEVLDTSFATVVYVALDPAKGICRISSAGHPPPVVAYPDGSVALLEQAPRPPARHRDPDEVPSGNHRAPGRHRPRPLHGRARRTPRPVDRRRAARPAGRDPRRTEGPRSAPRAHPRPGRRDGERGDDIALLAARLLPVAPEPSN